MITLVNIQNAIGDKLGSKFNYRIYMEEVKKGKETPSFFVNIIPVNTDNFVAYKQKLINIDIMFFSLNETVSENLAMIDSLESLLSTTLTVLDRNLTIKSLDFKVVDNILHCNFSLDFADNNEVVTITKPNGETIDIPVSEIDESKGYTPEEITTMQELEIKEV